jgi:membrane-bound lytic murein transglycosylase D
MISFAPEIVLRRMMVKVQKGDTLATLASRHDVSPSNIAAWNKLKMPVALKPGQSIAILVPTTASSRGSKNTSKKSSVNKGVKASAGAPNAKQAKAQSKPSAPKTAKPKSPSSSVRN